MHRYDLLKRFGVVYFLLFQFIITKGQNTPLANVSIASPTAASLGKYADIPVQYHTGIPEITLPIYTVKEGPLELPISMSYHASGLKVMEGASWVGAGWALNAGGVITRSVQGAPDDRGIDAAATDYGHFWNFGYNNYLFELNGPPCNTPLGCPVGAPRNADDIAITNGHKDGEPDLYFFNFSGYTGKFFFRDDRQPVIIPAQDLRITPVFSESTQTVSHLGMEGFVITTPDGTQYTFGKNPEVDGNINAIEITSSINTHTTTITNQGAISSWYLNKITSADRNFSISLIYEADKSSSYTLSMFPVWNVGNNVNTFMNSYGDYEYDLAKNFINGVRLSKIIFSNGTVTFSPGAIRNDVGDFNSMVLADVANTQSRTLGSISVTDSKGFCKKDSLYYSYFEDNINPLQGFYVQSFPALSNIQSDRYRLKLDAVQEITCDGSSQLPPHKFEYFPETVARKLSFGQDHWGFYNGVTNNTTLIPTYTVTGSTFVNQFPGAQRDATWPAMRGGTLNKITYPTGGSTSFEFESNSTFCNYITYTSVSRGTLSVGFDGSSNPISSQMTFSGNTYSLTLTNTPAGGTASFIVTDLNNNIIFNATADAGATKTFDFVVTPGNYTIKLQKNSAQPGYGAGSTISEIVPTSTSGNQPVGGLRIKKITVSDNISSLKDIVTSYNYNTAANVNGQSSGILYSRPIYVSLLRNDILKAVGGISPTPYCSLNGCSSCDGSSNMSYYKSGTAIMPMSTSQGNHIGYNEVTVSQTNNGYSIYRYYGSSVWDNIFSDVAVRSLNTSACSLNTPNFPAAPLPFEYMRGELKYQGSFRDDGSALSETFHFPSFMNDSILTQAYKAVFLGGTNNYLFGTEYDIVTQHKIQDKIIEYYNDPSSNTYVSKAKIKYYDSKFHTQPTRIVTYKSPNDSLITLNKYAIDFRVSNCDSIASGYKEWVDAYNGVLNSYGINNNCSSNTGVSCHYKAYQQYRWDKSVVRRNFINRRITSFSGPNNTFAANHLTAKSAADQELKPILELQDQFNNPLIETSNWKNAKVLNASFSRFDYGTNSNELYPEKTKLVNLVVPTTSFNQAVVVNNTISIDNKYKEEFSYKYLSGNASQITKRGDIISSYIWGYQNRFPVAKIDNSMQSDVAYTSFEADGNGNWSGIQAGGIDQTGGQTGRRSYNMGSSTLTKGGLTQSKIFTVSYWKKSGSVTISGGTSTVTIGPTRSGWTYYEHTVSLSGSSISISGSAQIDELRLFPKEAEMTTYTYDPLIGMTSQTDPGNRTTYYEYDGFTRLKMIRDQDRRIVKKFDYSYAAVSLKDSLNKTLSGFRQYYAAYKDSITSGRWTYYTNQGTLTNPYDFISNGVLHLPASYDTIAPDFVNPIFYPNVSYCVSDGYSIEARVKHPQNNKGTPAWDVAMLGSELFHYYITIDSVSYFAGYLDATGQHYGLYAPMTGTFDDWRTIKFKITPGKISIYFEGQLIREVARDSTVPISSFNRMYIAFKGHDGSVDWVKIYNANNVVKYFEDFTDPYNLSKASLDFICPPVDCASAFTTYFNQAMGTSYTYNAISALYLQQTGQALDVCN